MNFLLDTNVVSEWAKPRPDPGVGAWLADVDEDRVFLSVVTLAEIRYAIERLPDGRRRKRLDDWLQNDLPARFSGRILTVDTGVAEMCGRVMARSEQRGRPIGGMDALLAATAQAHGLALVTRNAADFEACLNSVVNPWTHGQASSGREA